MIEKPKLPLILEAAIMASIKPLSIDQLANLFPEDQRPDNNEIQEALVTVSDACTERGFELKQVASGFRFQVRQELAPWIGGMLDEKPQKYTRALLETLALIAYRQPITRGEIEEIRGVSVSSNIVRTLQERNWVRVVGHRDVPGRPAMFATTRQFLDYFNLENLNELPTLSDIRDLEATAKELEAQMQISSENTTTEATEKKEIINERSAQELFEELDAMEADLPDSFDDMIKKQKVDTMKLPISSSDSFIEEEPSAYSEEEPSAYLKEELLVCPEEPSAYSEEEPSACPEEPKYQQELMKQKNLEKSSASSNPQLTSSNESDELLN